MHITFHNIVNKIHKAVFIKFIIFIERGYQ